MRNIVNLLGVNFDNVTMDEAVDIGFSLLDQEAKSSIYTPNPEIVMAAYEDRTLQKRLNEAALVIPDGIGDIIGSRIIGKPLKERVAGFDFAKNLFAKMEGTDKTVFFYGSKPGIAKEAALAIKNSYKHLNIVGTYHGYEKDMSKVIDAINRVKPDLLLVGLGAPRQEAWIANYMDDVDAKVFIGVGGALDGYSGHLKRAPEVFIKLNLEWFYRLITQPTRWRRMLQLPRFIIKMLIEGRRYN